jgi:hypothetical protein
LADAGVAGPVAQLMNQQVSFTVNELELTVTVVPLPPAPPVQFVWSIMRSGNGAEVRWTDSSY